MLLPLLLTGCIHRSMPSFAAAEYDYAHGNYPRAFQELWTPAEKNDPRALYAMGYMYYYGVGTDKDQDLGRSLIRRAAAKNYPPAITALELITKRRRNQYLPFEKYNANDEGIIEVNGPLIKKGYT